MTWVAAGVASGAATNAAVMYFKKKRDQKRDEKNRPEYQTPDEINQNLASAKSYAAQSGLEGIPEEQKQQFLSNIQRSQAYGLNQLSTRKAGLAGVASLNQASNDAYGNLMAQDAGQRIQNQRYGQQLVSGANQTMADYKDQAFQFNKVNPYYEHIARRDSRDQQLSQSLNNAGQLVGGAFGGNMNTQRQQPIQNQYGGQPPSAPYQQTYQINPWQTQGYPTTSQQPMQTGQQIDINNGAYKSGNYWY